jgi:hypothetical protein
MKTPSNITLDAVCSLQFFQRQYFGSWVYFCHPIKGRNVPTQPKTDIPASACSDWGKQLKTSAGIFCALAKI